MSEARASDQPASPEGTPRRGTVAARRPPAVTILALIQLLGAFGYGSVLVTLLANGVATIDFVAGKAVIDPAGSTEVQFAIALTMIGAYFLASMSAGVLLLRMRQLGWTITMLLTGLGLASAISVWWFRGTAISIWLAIQVITVFYLNQRQVRQAFGISGTSTGPEMDEEGA